ncbi:MAG: ATP-binding protein, partial [Alphaproteobacteria bacterium]|nr:ATP-binding protein [Alphaproteobacteria bacterium]
PSLPNIAVTPGDEHLLRTLPASALQSVVDYVAQQVEPALGAMTSDEKALVAVTFTSGIELKYRRWMLTKRGHDLLPIYQRVFGQTVITPPKLERSFRRVRLVPIELAKIMSRLQET